MKKKFFLLFGCLYMLWLSQDSFALRCGHLIVELGDHKADVFQKCGRPDFVDERLAAVGSTLRHPAGVLQLDQSEQIVIEEWTYNFGPRRFKQLLIFENSILVEINDLSRGR
ncbi:MAG: DUF2845 domain-containing protein [Methylococcaceae bacterium]